MTAVLYTPHFIQFIDNTGAPLNGGKLWTYAAGTTTPKATYTTAAGTIPNANPVVLDAYGRAIIFLDGAYKFLLTDSADVPVGPSGGITDNITSFASSASVGGSIDDLTTIATATIASSDYVIFQDVSNSNVTRRDTVLSLLNSSIATTAEIVSGIANKIVNAEGLAPLLYLTKLSQSAGQSIATATWTALTFDTEAIDNGAWHSTSVNTNRVTPTVAGWYEVIGSVAFNTTSNARVAVGIAKNGTLGVTASTYVQLASNDIGDTVSEIVQLNGTTDYVEIQAYHNNGSNLSTLTVRTSFSVRRVK